MSDSMQGLERLEQMRRSFEGVQQRAQEVASQVAATVVEVADEEARLSATVGSNGVQSLTIDPKSMRLGSEELAERIVALLARGQEELGAKVQQLTSEMFSGMERPGLPDELR